MSLQEIEQSALKLTETERAKLATQLLGSLPPVLAEEDDGVAEALRRDAELDANPSDAMTLNDLHDQVACGIRAPRTNSDRVIWEEGIHRITVVNFDSPAVQKQRAERIAKLAHWDMDCDFPPYRAEDSQDDRNAHLFLGYSGNRGMGLVVVERREHIWRCLSWEDYGRIAHQVNHEPIWSVGLVWIHKRHRRQGWGTRLVNEVGHFFDLEIGGLGWFTPFSAEGEKLVRKLCPSGFLIAK